MAKTKFTRQNLKSDILKKIIIRVDYQGVSGISEIDSFIIKLKHDWQTYFQQYGILQNKNFNVNFDKAGLKSFDTEIRQIHRFFSCRIGRSKAFMDITDKFTCIEIDCASPYEGSDGYLDCMAHFIKELKSFVKFLEITRIGIRKFDYIIKDLSTELDAIIEEPLWSKYLVDGRVTPEKKEYKDFLILNNGTQINLGRIIEQVKINNEDKYRLTFDADAYRQNERLDNNSMRNVEMNKQLLKDINNPLFDFFVKTFTEEYLNQFYNG